MRNRSEGWKYAKLSGHENEKLIHDELLKNHQFASHLFERIGKSNFISISYGGLTEKSVVSILGSKTKSKTDMIITWADLSVSKISIKKSWGGQVYLIKTSSFIEGYQIHYGAIPEIVQEALMLYFGEHPKTLDILNSDLLKDKISWSIRDYQFKKNRLVWDALAIYNECMANSMLEWIMENIGNIAEFCFSRGLAKEKSNWSDLIWYINLIDDDQDIDELYSIKQLVERCIKHAKSETFVGHTNGGSTIQLPFGFLQWHQGRMQFHHGLERIMNIMQ